MSGLYNNQSVTSSNSEENTIWTLYDGQYTYPLNIDDMTVCICMHDEKQKCTCMCHKMWGTNDT